MNIKVIATDLDGTLLNKKYWISKKNTLALKKFIENGGIVCFTTGRSLQSAIEVAQKIENKGNVKIKYLSCLKGAILYDNIEQKIIYNNVIDYKIARNIYDLAMQNHCMFSTYLESDISNKNMVIANSNNIINFFHIFGKFKNFIKLENPDVINENNSCYKINIGTIFHPNNLQKLYQQIKEKFYDKLEISLTSKFMYEITNLNCNKGEAIVKISELLNIKLDQFAAFGDSHNDLEIFNKVGLSIAITSRCKPLCDAANYVISSKQSIAVAKGINKYIFNE